MSITWADAGAGVGEVHPEVFVPVPVTQGEREFAAGVMAAQDAQVWPVEDPADGAYWELLGDIEETVWAEVAGQGPAAWPTQELSRGLSAAAAGVGRASLTQVEVVRVFDPGLVAGLEAVGRVRAGLDAVAFALALEASRRGLPAAVGLGLVDWLRVRCPWLSAGEAAQVRVVVDAAGQHWGAPIAQALSQGRAGLHRLARVAGTVGRLAGSLDTDQREAYAGIATGAACDAGISDRDLGRVCARLVVDLLEDGPREEADQVAQELRCVSRRRVGPGLVRFTVDAPDTDAVLIDGILGGPLAAPDPGQGGEAGRGGKGGEAGRGGQGGESAGGPGEQADPRSAGQRRYDALVMVLGRGLSNPGAPPSTGRASVIITVSADPVTGEPAGAASAQAGDAVLSAGQAGRFACLGDLTPVVLGRLGEPLRLGRTARLATPGQFKALIVRDDQCTFPGCSVPGAWCEAHHLIWWCHGGSTDIETLALLCPRHHTLVHAKDLMATVTGGAVTWHV